MTFPGEIGKTLVVYVINKSRFDPIIRTRVDKLILLHLLIRWNFAHFVRYLWWRLTPECFFNSVFSPSQRAMKNN